MPVIYTWLKLKKIHNIFQIAFGYSQSEKEKRFNCKLGERKISGN